MFDTAETLRKHIVSVETENNDYRDLWTKKMPAEKVEELIPAVTAEDVLDDNDNAEDSIDLDNEQGHAARMFSMH